MDSSIGKKVLVAVTGLILALFVLSHMLGNLLLFAGPETFNTYSHNLVTNPLIYFVEGILVLVFVVHVGLAINLTYINRMARGSSYALKPNGEKAPGLASQTMIFHGLYLFVFVIVHLITFKFGTVYMYKETGMRDIYRLVLEVFQSPLYVGGYIISMAVLGVHLYHGVSSVFQTWGFNHPKYTIWLKNFGVFYAIFVAVGFMASPILGLVKIYQTMIGIN